MSVFDSFLRKYHEGSVPVGNGVPSADETEEIEYFPTRGGGDASGRMAYDNGRKGDGPRGLRDTGRRLAPESEDDSRRGAGGPGYPVDKSEPDDMMAPGWRGPALDDPGALKDAYTGEPRAVQAAPLRVSVRCSKCGETAKVKLPGHIKVARAAEGEGKGRIMRTRCACGEGIRFHAPAGHVFAKRESALFWDKYNYLTGRGSNPVTRGLRSAREAFRRSYFGR